MNLGLGLSNLGATCKANAPEILLVAGTISFIGTVVTACRATIKAKEIMADAKKDLEIIDNTLKEYENDEERKDEYTEVDCKTDKRNVMIQTGWQMIKKYAIPALLATATLFCFYKSHGIMVRRNAALGAALTSVTAMYQEYRQRVRDKYGKEADFDLAHNAGQVTTWEDDGNGNTTEETVKIVSGKNNLYTYYINLNNPRFVDQGCNLDSFRTLANGIADCFNEKLRARATDTKLGTVVINEILPYLAIHTNDEEGMVCGWTSEDKIEISVEPCKFVDDFGEIVDGLAVEFNATGSVYKKAAKKSKGRKLLCKK